MNTQPGLPADVSNATFEYHWMMDSGFAARRQRALLVNRAVTSWQFYVLVAIQVGLGSASVIMLALGGPVPRWESLAGIAIVVFVSLRSLGLAFARTRRAPTYEEGAVFETRFSASALYLRKPGGVEVFPYTGYKAITRRMGFVFLRERGTKSNLAIPEVLFPPEKVAWVRDHLG